MRVTARTGAEIARLIPPVVWPGPCSVVSAIVGSPPVPCSCPPWSAGYASRARAEENRPGSRAGNKARKQAPGEPATAGGGVERPAHPVPGGGGVKSWPLCDQTCSSNGRARTGGISLCRQCDRVMSIAQCEMHMSMSDLAIWQRRSSIRAGLDIVVLMTANRKRIPAVRRPNRELYGARSGRRAPSIDGSAFALAPMPCGQPRTSLTAAASRATPSST